MCGEKIISRGFELIAENSMAEIAVEDYIRDYRDTDRFIGYCKACDRYGANWACPPFGFDAEEYIRAYERAYVIGTKILIGGAAASVRMEPSENRAVSYSIIKQVREALDVKLLEAERTYPGSRAFFAGTCLICPREKCARIAGKPCVAPGSIRPSLESFGFDMGKTSSELLNIEMKWGQNGFLPEYFTLVSGFFTNNERHFEF